MPRSRSKSPRARAFEALRELLRDKVTEEDSLPGLFDFENHDMRRYADRAAALITATILEQGLEYALASHFVELDPNEHRDLFSEDADAPLSSFAARVRLAYALGVFGPKTRDDLTCIRAVRNAFAHAKAHLNFQSPQIIAVCDLLHYPTRVKAGFLPIMEDPQSARDKYITTAQFLTIYFFGTPHEGPIRYKQSSWADLAD
jgi:DNA-binding MltR family transcriptional regulator